MSLSLMIMFAGLALTAGSRNLSEPRAQTPFHEAALNIGHHRKLAPAIPSLDVGCVFANGVTTCTSVDEYTYTTLRSAVSGCLYGPNAIPGRRTRTFEDTYLVSVTTTTVSHGKSGPVYDSSSTSSQTLIGSQQISDVCEPI